MPRIHGREAQERAEAIMLYDMHLAASKAEGKIDGKAELLLRLLGKRFGPLSDDLCAKVHAATHAHLDTWADRILTATSIDEVLAP